MNELVNKPLPKHKKVTLTLWRHCVIFIKVTPHSNDEYKISANQIKVFWESLTKSQKAEICIYFIHWWNMVIYISNNNLYELTSDWDWHLKIYKTQYTRGFNFKTSCNVKWVLGWNHKVYHSISLLTLTVSGKRVSPYMQKFHNANYLKKMQKQ